MSKFSRMILTTGALAALALSAPLLASAVDGDREARQGEHRGHMMMARAHGEGEYGRKGCRHEQRGDMSDEQRKAHRDEKRMNHMAMRMHWDTLSDAEKESYQLQAQMRMDERRAAWEAMSPEERQAKREEMREKMQERHGEMGGHRH